MQIHTLFFSKTTGDMKTTHFTCHYRKLSHVFPLEWLLFNLTWILLHMTTMANRWTIWNVCCMKHRRLPAWYHSQRRMPETLVWVPEEQRQEDRTLACAVQSKQHWGWWLKYPDLHILIDLTLWLCTILSSTIHFHPTVKLAPTVLISLTSLTIVHFLLRALTTSYYVISGLDNL